MKPDHNNIISGEAEWKCDFTETKRQCEIITATESFWEPPAEDRLRPLTELLWKGTLLWLDVSVYHTESCSL